jgi:hypothetical protein
LCLQYLCDLCAIVCFKWSDPVFAEASHDWRWTIVSTPDSDRKLRKEFVLALALPVFHPLTLLFALRSKVSVLLLPVL